MSRNKRTRRPATAPAHSPARVPVALLIALGVFVLCAVYMMPYMPDDAYISFRYAEHFADGHGLTFNVGQKPVEAYSNFLWILFCAALYKMGSSLPAVTPWVGIVLGGVCITIVWTLVRRRAPLWTQQLPPMLLLAASAPFVMYVVSGMESVLYALCLLLMLRLTEDFLTEARTKTALGMALSGLAAALARPEGVVMLPLCLVCIAWALRGDDRRRSALRALGIAAIAFAVATAIYHVWRISYFDGILPTPFLSKGSAGLGLVSSWQSNLSTYFVNWAYYSPPPGYYFLALFALAFASVRVTRGERSPQPQTDRIALALALALAAIYLNFVDWMPGMRYHTAAVGLLLVPACQLHRLIPDPAWRATATTARRGYTLACGALLVVCCMQLTHLKVVAKQMREGTELCYRPLAEWLRNSVPPSSLFAIGDVGQVPYYSKLRTIDIHPESLTDIHIAKENFSPDYILRRKPDVIAFSVRGVYSAKMDPLHYELHKLERFQQQYRFVGTVRHWWFEDRCYWVYVNLGTPVRMDEMARLPTGIGKQHRSGFEE